MRSRGTICVLLVLAVAHAVCGAAPVSLFGGGGASNGGASSLSSKNTAAKKEKSLLPSMVELKGVVDDCCCPVERVDKYNTEQVFPVLAQLVNTTFFNYFRVNYERPCPYWAETHLCSITGGGGCGVCECSEEEIPRTWLTERAFAVDASVGSEFVEPSRRNGDQRDVWCDCDEDEPGMKYINLKLNPERYTGYVGYNATRIWFAIYNDNCFGGSGLCLEQRTLNRLISGFHGSTTAHICEMFWVDGQWSPNVEMFAWKLGRFEEFMKNIYFSFLFVARAVGKIKDTLLSYPYDTGKPDEDARTRALIQQLFSAELLCSPTFDESQMFNTENKELREELRLRFRNISQIMDCVECETCKIHAKLQMLGIGTALKILLPVEDGRKLTLQRNEVIALINTFFKFSDSVAIINKMKERMERWNEEVKKQKGEQKQNKNEETEIKKQPEQLVVPALKLVPPQPKVEEKQEKKQQEGERKQDKQQEEKQEGTKNKAESLLQKLLESELTRSSVFWTVGAVVIGIIILKLLGR